MPGHGRGPFRHGWPFPRHGERRSRAGDRSHLGEARRWLSAGPGGLPARGRTAGITCLFPWLLSAFGLQHHHAAEKWKRCGIHWSAPGFGGTRVIYFGFRFWALQRELWGALAQAEACGQPAAGLSHAPCLSRVTLPLKAPNQNKTAGFCLLVVFF